MSAAIACYILNNLTVVADLVRSGINKIMYGVHNFGWLPFIMAVWVKIQLPVQFLVFWIILFAVQFYRYVCMQLVCAQHVEHCHIYWSIITTIIILVTKGLLDVSLILI